MLDWLDWILLGITQVDLFIVWILWAKVVWRNRVYIAIMWMEALKKKTDNPAEEDVFFKFPYNDAVDDCIAILRDLQK